MVSSVEQRCVVQLDRHSILVKISAIPLETQSVCHEELEHREDFGASKHKHTHSLTYILPVIYLLHLS